MYSTHCTAVKGIYMLLVNLASGSFVTAFVKVVKVFLIKSNVRSRWLLHLSVPPEGFPSIKSLINDFLKAKVVVVV